MKVLAHIQRSLPGLIFVVTGLNGFFRFLDHPPFTAAAARELIMLKQATPYGHMLSALQIVCGFLLLARLFVPIAPTILAGYLFNIFMFQHTFNPLALFASVLWVRTFLRNRDAFRTILHPRLSKTLTMADG